MRTKVTQGGVRKRPLFRGLFNSINEGLLKSVCFICMMVFIQRRSLRQVCRQNLELPGHDMMLT